MRFKGTGLRVRKPGVRPCLGEILNEVWGEMQGKRFQKKGGGEGLRASGSPPLGVQACSTSSSSRPPAPLPAPACFEPRNGAAPQPQPRLSQAGSSRRFSKSFSCLEQGGAERTHGSLHMGSVLALHPHPSHFPMWTLREGGSPESHVVSVGLGTQGPATPAAPRKQCAGSTLQELRGRVSEAARGPGRAGGSGEAPGGQLPSLARLQGLLPKPL